jgi:hypothetical protein
MLSKMQPPDCNNVYFINSYWKTIDNCIDWYRSNTLFIEAYYEAMYYKEQNASATYDVSARPTTYSPARIAVDSHGE